MSARARGAGAGAGAGSGALGDAVIVDVDGTLCDVSGVRHYVTSDPGNRNYDRFHAASALCPPIPSAVEWVAAQRALGRTIIVVTARKRRWEFVTRRWLRKWEIHCDWLLMRPDADQRRDREVKADILALIRSRGYRVVAAIDDNPAVVELWESQGIPVTVVPGWGEDPDPSLPSR